MTLLMLAALSHAVDAADVEETLNEFLIKSDPILAQRSAEKLLKGLQSRKTPLDRIAVAQLEQVLGMIALRRGDTQEAEAHFVAACAFGRDHPVPLNQRIAKTKPVAEAYSNACHNHQAQGTLLIDHAPRDARLWLDGVRVTGRVHQVREGAHWVRMLSMDPDVAPLLVRRVVVAPDAKVPVLHKLGGPYRRPKMLLRASVGLMIAGAVAGGVGAGVHSRCMTFLHPKDGKNCRGTEYDPQFYIGKHTMIAGAIAGGLGTIGTTVHFGRRSKPHY